MSVKMSDDEVASFLAESITATIITINPSGIPLPAPVWYVNKGPVIFFRTMRKTQKSKNIFRDPRTVVQVEAGLKYLELRAVVTTGTAIEVTDAAEVEWFESELSKKYKTQRAPSTALPDATKKHYDNPGVFFKVTPTKVKTWDNRKIRTGNAA
jgi:nitroimidazol reductase NimA-like FMN-containing flavoprotein (pyridoxamine 5'-phosphate oxidase superfamily)